MDKEIMGYLGSEKVFAKERIVHNYPSCWRCHTPLVYYANPSWYISMSDLRDELVANNNTVNWYPDFVGERRGPGIAGRTRRIVRDGEDDSGFTPYAY